MKKLAIVAGVVLIVVIGAVVFVGANLDKIVHQAIERVGSNVLGVDVSVGGVELQLTEGRGSIRDLRVANPPGYSRSPALSLGDITLDVDYTTQVVELARAGAPDINIEFNGNTNNFEDLLGNIGSGDSDKSEIETDSGDPLVLQINRLEIDKASASMNIESLDQPLEISIEQMVFQNLKGTGEEIGAQVFRQLLSRVRDGISTAVADAARGAIEEKKDEVVDGAKDKIHKKLLDRN